MYFAPSFNCNWAFGRQLIVQLQDTVIGDMKFLIQCTASRKKAYLTYKMLDDFERRTLDNSSRYCLKGALQNGK